MKRNHVTDEINTKVSRPLFLDYKQMYKYNLVVYDQDFLCKYLYKSLIK